MEKTGTHGCDLVDGCVEGGFVGLGGLVEAADLPDELERGVAHLLVGHGGIEVEEVFDVSAHVGIIGKCAPAGASPSSTEIVQSLRFRYFKSGLRASTFIRGRSFPATFVKSDCL